MAVHPGHRNPTYEETIKLYTLLREGDVDGLTTMYKDNKIDLSANLDGQTALHLAVGYNKIISVKTLIELGANIDVVDFNGNTPLHWALQNGFNEIVHYFVKVCKQNMNVKWFSEDSRKQAYGIADSYENQHQHSSIQGSDDKDLIQL